MRIAKAEGMVTAWKAENEQLGSRLMEVENAKKDLVKQNNDLEFRLSKADSVKDKLTEFEGIHHELRKEKNDLEGRFQVVEGTKQQLKKENEELQAVSIELEGM